MSKKFNLFINIMLLIFPFVDILTTFQIRSGIIFPSIGAVIRGIFLIIIIIYLYKRNINKKMLLIFALYSFLNISYIITNTNNNIITEISNLFEIFYLPFLIYFFNNYENKKIDDKLIVILYLIYLNLIIVPYIFGIGYNLSEIYVNKVGYYGLFFSGNEVSAIILGLMPIVINYVINSKSYVLKILVYLEILISCYLIGTKTLFIGLIIVIIYFLVRYLKYHFDKLNKILLSMGLLIFIFLMAIIFPKTPVYKNINETLRYYEINSIDDITSIKAIDNVIFSKRLSFLKNIDNEYKKLDIYGYLYGLGRDKILSIKDIEIDIFDIFYSIGIFGTFIWIILMINSCHKFNLRKEYKFSFNLFILMSIFSGHVLIKPMVSIFISILFILNKNSLKIEKKKILLVSNMYPSKKYKFYGTFVKNTKEILEENGFIVDKAVMYKTTNKINKLLSYIKIHSLTILKCIFNNYDYIYVHFISHSSLGAVIAKNLCKNTKLVLNAHGNDVVKDYEYEEKLRVRSKGYLKHADKVVVPSKYYKDVMINDYNVDSDMIYVYPSGGVNIEKFKNIDKIESKKKVGLKEEFSYIGYISRIEKNKGWDVFLKTIKNLEETNNISNKRFLIVGTGNEEEEMKKLINDLDILKYLEIRNMVSQEELVYIYNSLDIFVFPTYRKSESLGLVGLEALACEVFLIASKNYGPTDYVIDNKNGLFFEPKDDLDLMNKILKLENLNNEQKKKMLKKGRVTAEKYSNKNTKELLLKVFK